MTTQIYTDGLLAFLDGIAPESLPSPREQLDNRVVAYVAMHMPKKLGPGDPGFMTFPEKLPLIPTSTGRPARNMSLHTLFGLWKRFCEGDLEPSEEEAMQDNLLALIEEEFDSIQPLFTAYAREHSPRHKVDKTAGSG